MQHWLSPWLPLAGPFYGGIVPGALIVFAIQFLLSLFLGRAFCGWVCPVGGLQECLLLASDKKAKVGKRDLIKWVIWFPWIVLIIALFIRAGGVKSVMPQFGVSEGTFLGYVIWYVDEIQYGSYYRYYIYYGVISLVVVLALAFGKRTYCHSVCWMAPFMIIGTKISQRLKLPGLCLKPAKENCNGCNSCSRKCLMSLNVKDMVLREDMRNAECILCGECVDTCSKKAVKYSF
jgi:polyferredoxin